MAFGQAEGDRTMAVTKVGETRDQAVHRLARKAEKEGVKVFVYPRTGEYYANSVSSPGELHRVTLVSCDCQGFLYFGRCKHHSALLAELDELPPLEPTPIETAVQIDRIEIVNPVAA